MSFLGAAHHLVRLSLSSYPQEFRERHGADMMATFETQLVEQSRVAGPAGVVGFAVRTAVSVFAAGLRERLGSRLREGSGRPGVVPVRGIAAILGEIRQDLQYGWRTIQRSPGMALTAILTLGLGIGAVTAVFSVVDTVLLKPLPFRSPDQLVRIWTAKPSVGLDRYFVAPADYAHMKRALNHFTDVAAYRSFETTVGPKDADPIRVPAGAVSWNFFRLLGTEPLLGNTFGPADEPAGASVVVLSYGYWRRAFGADPDVVGKTLHILGVANFPERTILGVMPPEFDLPADVDFWTPVPNLATGVAMYDRWLNVVGRMEPGAGRREAQLEVRSLARLLKTAAPERNSGWTLVAEPLHEALVGKAKPVLLLLFGSAALMLAIACANVANLMLLRAEHRVQETALRASLGAARSRIIRQLMTEHLLFAVFGSIAGFVIASFGIDILGEIGKTSFPRLEHVAANSHVLLFAIALSGVTGIVFGVAPSFKLARTDLTSALKQGDRGNSPGADRMRNMFVVMQLALSIVLVSGAALLARSFQHILRSDPGFSADNLVTMEIGLPVGRYGSFDEVERFYGALLQRVNDMPRVIASGIGSNIPLTAGLDYPGELEVVGSGRDRNQTLRPYFREVSGGFFKAMRIPLLRGRGFDGTEAEDTPGVVIVNESAAFALWRSNDVLGKEISGVKAVWGNIGEFRLDRARVIGVVRDVRYDGLKEKATPSIYFPYRQAPFRRMSIAVRTTADPRVVASRVRGIVRDMDAELAVSNIWTMNALIQRAAARDRFTLILAAVFAGVALVLAAVGVYGVMAYSVERRSREIGIRMALGAQSKQVLGAMLRHTAAVVATGALLGLAGAALAGRAVRSQLFEVSPYDPLVLAGVTLFLGAVAFVAALPPAIRAMHVDPVETLEQV